MKCNICKKEQNEDQFAWRNKAKGTRQLACHPCRRAAAKVSYQKNRTAVIDKVYGRIKTTKAAFRAWKQKQSCEVCGESATECLDLHHRNPAEKDFNISAWDGGISKLWAEVAKCIVLCANCHRKVHSGRINCPGIPLDYESSER